MKRIIDELSKGNRKFIITHLDNDIKWNIVGMPEVTGKEDFLKVMEIMQSAIGGFSRMYIKNIISEGEYVVVESSAGNENFSGKTFNPSYCEVYRFKNGKILELTSYIVDASD
jgi:ketosteroid isomerase-like protein